MTVEGLLDNLSKDMMCVKIDGNTLAQLYECANEGCQSSNTTDRATNLIRYCFAAIYRELSAEVLLRTIACNYSSYLRSSIERGLYLDLLLYTISNLHDLIFLGETTYVENTIKMDDLPSIRQLDRALELNWDFINPITKQGENGCFRYYFPVSKQRQFEHFFASSAPPIPDLRSPNATKDTTIFSFEKISKAPKETLTSAEYWNIFYLQEKRYGVNLAALISSFCHNLADYNQKSNSIWNYFMTPVMLQSELNTVGAVKEKHSPFHDFMRLPFPAFRLSYIQSAINEYLNSDYPIGNHENNFNAFMTSKYMPWFIESGRLTYSNDDIIFSSKKLEDMQHTAYCLMLCVCAGAFPSNPKKDNALMHPDKDVIISKLSDKRWINSLLFAIDAEIKYTIRAMGGAKSTDFHKPESNPWPLLLISDNGHDQIADHIEALLKTKAGAKKRKNQMRNNHTRAFAEVWKKLLEDAPDVCINLPE